MFNFNFNQANPENKKTGDTVQNINIVDVICEGPVKGLVDGVAGVYLNDVSVEHAEFREWTPVQTSSSGTIVFSGSSTGTVDSNSTIPDDLENISEVPRSLVLANYLEQEVSISLNGTLGAGGFYSYTLTATSGTPFTAADWNTTTPTKTLTLYRDGQSVVGTATTASTTTMYFWVQNDPKIDISSNYTLRVSRSFPITNINSSSSTVTVSGTPTSGTYNFAITKQPTAEEIAGEYFGQNKNKIKNLVVQSRNGYLNQDPLPMVDGVGGVTSIPGSTSGVNLPSLKLVSSSAASTLGVSRIDAAGMPSGSEDFNDDATILDPADFGLDSSAKISEADLISWSIRYPAFQTINLESGDKETAHAYYVMELRTQIDGTWQDWVNAFPNVGNYVIHQGNTNAPSTFEHVLSLEQYRPFDNFQVRVIRVTRHLGLPVVSDGTSGNRTKKDKWQLNASANISGLSAIIADRFSYPYTALASVTFSSKQFNNTPKRSYLMEGLLVKIPSNYTPRDYDADGVAQYDGFWDGTFKDELFYTDNPAWVFYDIVTNNRYGAGKWITASDIDKYSLYRVARYCDELVDDGNGGTEPRFRANVFLAKSTDVYKVLKDMATIFLGILYWQDGQLVASQDTPQDPVYTFSKSNVIDGAFSYESTGARTRINQVIVTWNDPTINYEPVPVIVEDRASIVKTGRIISQPSVAFGATSEGQAIRYGRWKLWTAQNQTEIVSFKTSLAAQFIKPGDVINVQDADKYGVQLSGRISSVAVDETVTLDRSINFNSGSTYTLSTLVTDTAAFWSGASAITINSATYSSGDRIPQAYVPGFGLTDLDTEEKASNAFKEAAFTTPLALVWREYSYIQTDEIDNPGTTTNEVEITTNGGFGTLPVTNTVWAITQVTGGEENAASPKEYKVLSIAQSASNEYSISAVEFYNEKFTAIEEGYELGAIPTTATPGTEPSSIPAPTNLRISLATDASAPGEELLIEWDEPDTDFVANYEVEHNIDGIDSPLVVNKPQILLTEIPDGLLLLQVRTVSPNNNYSRYDTLQYFVEDPFNSNVPRMQEGIPKGIIANNTILVNSDDEVAFEKDPSIAVSVADFGENARTIDANDNIDVSGLDTGTEYFVLLEDSTIELVYYETEALQNLRYWKVIPDGGNYLSSQSANWTSLTGTASVSASSTTISGSSSSWVSEVKPRDILIFGNATDLAPYNITGVTKSSGIAVEIAFVASANNLFTNTDRVFIEGTGGSLELNNNYYYINNVSSTLRQDGDYDYTLKLYSNPTATTIIDSDTITAWTSGGTLRNSPPAALVNSIISDTEVRLDRSFTEEIPSGTTVRRRTYRPSFSADAIFAKVSYNGSSYDLTKFITLNPDLAIGRDISVSVNVPALQYDQSGDTTNQINSPSSLTVTATAIGFKDPVFKVSTISSNLDGAVDTTFQDPDVSGEFVYTKTVDANGEVDYDTGQAEEVVIQAAERYNTNDAISTEAFFVKVRDGAIGLDGIFVNLTGERASVSYSKNTNGTYDADDNSIQLTVDTFGITNPQYSWSGQVTNASATTATNSIPFSDGVTQTIAKQAKTATVEVTGQNSKGTSITAIQKSITIGTSVGAVGEIGDAGAPGPRSVFAYIYYQTDSTNAPTVPALSTFTPNFTNGSVSSSNSNWSSNTPTFVAGNTNKYWYFTFTATESGTYNDGYPSVTKSSSPSAGSSAIQGIGFSGLVTFSSANNIDGFNPIEWINDNGASTGTDNTTTIDGGLIRTNTIVANKLAFTPITSVAGVSGSSISTAQLSSAGLTLTEDLGSLASQDTVDLVNDISGNLPTTSGGTGSSYSNLTALANGIAATTAFGDLASLDSISATSSYITGLGDLATQNESNLNFIGLSSTVVQAGKITLGTSGVLFDDADTSHTVVQNAIILDTSGSANAIYIYDGSALRVKLGKLS